MKKVCLFVLFTALIISAQGQPPIQWETHFDEKFYRDSSKFVFDTVSNPNNIWQVGKPQKNTFDSAYSHPNALVTDTINSYPDNDTSIFYVFANVNVNRTAIFGFRLYYKLDIDSGDFGKIEVSGDSGAHWVDVLKEDTVYDFRWQGPDIKPRLDTSTNDWKRLDINMDEWKLAPPFSNKYPSYVTSDTFLIRFTFISDSTQSNKDGWMIDDFKFLDAYDNISEVSNDNLISIYPNPAKEHIYIKANYNYYAAPKVTIYDRVGRVVLLEQQVPPNNYLNIDLPNGVYTLKYTTDAKLSVKQLVINK